MKVPGVDQYDLRLDYEVSERDVDRALSAEPGDVKQEATVTFCKNVFLPLTTACRYTCTYCTYFDVPGEATLMSEEELRHEFEAASHAGCREALFTFGDKPDDRYGEIHDLLEQWGYEDILDYLYDACVWALDHGLLPHSNPGDLTFREMERLKNVNASMGVMLETTTDLNAHSGPRVKEPAQRLQTLEYAGRLKIPFTTGILVGIGETWQDRAHSLICLRRLQQEFEHIQEVIVQPVVPNERSDYETPPVEDIRRVVSMARVVLPDSVEVQVPPNLYDVGNVMDCGVGDLGGVSPVTDDYINPDYKWPALRELETLSEEHQFELKERGPVYEKYVDDEGWVSDRVMTALNQQSNKKGVQVTHG